MRQITCINENGKSIMFGERAFTPFLLAHVEGLYSTNINASITDHAVLDGGVYQASRMPVRNIVITITDKPNNVYGLHNRDILREVFAKGVKGKLIYNEDGVERSAEYYVESITPGQRRLYTISLLCPDPYFYDPEYNIIQLADWNSQFEFPHEFQEEGEELGTKTDIRLANIVRQEANQIGLIMKLTATGTVVNPFVRKVTTNQAVRLGNETYPFEMQFGDIITISTEDGKKNVKLTRDGKTTSANQYITEDSEFFQLTQGDNYMGYGAASGEGNISMQVQYRNRYEGV